MVQVVEEEYSLELYVLTRVPLLLARSRVSCMQCLHALFHFLLHTSVISLYV